MAFMLRLPSRFVQVLALPKLMCSMLPPHRRHTDAALAPTTRAPQVACQVRATLRLSQATVVEQRLNRRRLVVTVFKQKPGVLLQVSACSCNDDAQGVESVWA